MDKKMREVSRTIRKGERLIEKGVKKNDKLADYDEKVRDPMIEKFKKMKKHEPKMVSRSAFFPANKKNKSK